MKIKKTKKKRLKFKVEAVKKYKIKEKKRVRREKKIYLNFFQTCTENLI